jgi:DNA-binding beta-propeller fold protein YncE
MARTTKLASSIVFGSILLSALAGCSRKQPPPPPPPIAAPPPPPAPKAHTPLARPSEEARDGSAIVLAKVGAKTVAYVADEADSAVRTVDLESNEVIARTSLDGRPGQMIVDKRGRLLVALRTEQAIAVLEATSDPKDTLDETARITTSAVEPLAMAITPDDSMLVVATAWGHSVEGYRLDTTQRRFVIDVAREPRAVTIASDGKTAFVAHAAASHLSSIPIPANANDEAIVATADVKKVEMTMPGFTEVRHGRRGVSNKGNPMLLFKMEGLSDIDDDPLDRGFTFRCGTGMMMHEITFPSRVARQSFALAKVSVKVKGSEGAFEERILAPHIEVATGDASVRSTGYGGGGLEEAEAIPSELFDIDVIDAKKSTRATKVAPVAANLRSGNEACRLPRAATVDSAHGRLYVACLGVNKVMEYDATSATPTGAFRRAIDVPAGPTAIAIDPTSEKAIVWSQFDRALSVFSIAEPAKTDDNKAAKAAPAAKPAPIPQPELTKIAFPAPNMPLTAEAAAGEKLFHSAGNTKISRDGRACASCHPDGRDDALVWSTPDGPRQTILLAGRVGRETPFGWLGKHGSLKEHITVTMKNLKGTGASDEELTQIVAWLRAMPSPPKTKPAAGMIASVQRGKELFNSSTLQCGTCHAEKTDFSDREAHDVASATGADVSRQFLVPSLRFVGGSGPYFHDGRYASLGELLQKNDKMGDTKSLPQEDRDALEAYLRTL